MKMTKRVTARARRSPWLLAQLALLTQLGIRAGHQASPALDVTRRGAAALRLRWPAAVVKTRTRARSVTRALDALPRSTAQSLTAGSLGFGAGLYLGKAPRIVKAIGVAPAFVLGASMLRRRDGGPDVRGDTDIARLDDDGSPSVAAPHGAVPKPG